MKKIVSWLEENLIESSKSQTAERPEVTESGDSERPEDLVEVPTQEELNSWMDDSDPTLDGIEATVPNLTTLDGKSPSEQDGYDPYDTAVLKKKE